MKKVILIICIFLIYFLLYFLQVNFFSWFTIAGVKPNLFVLFVLFIGLFVNGRAKAIFGFIIGLYTDFLFSNTIGISAILFCFIAISGEYLNKKFSNDSKITMVLLSSLVTALYESALYLYKIIVLSTNTNILAFIYVLTIEIVYNALLVIIFYPLIHKFGKYSDKVFKSMDFLPRYF